MATSLEQAVDRLISRDSRVVHENANKDSEVFATFRDLTAGVVSKNRGLAMLPPEVAEAHKMGTSIGTIWITAHLCQRPTVA